MCNRLRLSAGTTRDHSLPFSGIDNVFIRLPDFFEQRIWFNDGSIFLCPFGLRRLGLRSFTTAVFFRLLHRFLPFRTD